MLDFKDPNYLQNVGLIIVWSLVFYFMWALIQKLLKCAFRLLYFLNVGFITKLYLVTVKIIANLIKLLLNVMI